MRRPCTGVRRRERLHGRTGVVPLRPGISDGETPTPLGAVGAALAVLALLAICPTYTQPAAHSEAIGRILLQRDRIVTW